MMNISVLRKANWFQSEELRVSESSFKETSPFSLPISLYQSYMPLSFSSKNVKGEEKNDKNDLDIHVRERGHLMAVGC